ncbi:MAG: MBL fold metallo-hydrolase [Gemmatimonadales bacterium]
MRLTLLGTGTSFGVPQIGCRCAVCCSADPRDRRTRAAALVEVGQAVRRSGGQVAEDPGDEPLSRRVPSAESRATILIDTPPELRLQLLAAGVTRIDAVLYTHEHADHVQGIDDLRVFSVLQGCPIPLYAAESVLEFLRQSYRYIFDPSVTEHAGTSKPRLTLHPLEPGVAAEVAGTRLLALPFAHGYGTVLGFRIGPLGYVTDAKAVGPRERELLRGVEVLVLNALRWRPHPTHLSIPEAIEAARTIGARRAILTHLTHENGHAELAARLPPGIEPGYDGQVVEIGDA